jgi:RNA polymerase sigma-70 factor (ECF subfamily)
VTKTLIGSLLLLSRSRDETATAGVTPSQAELLFRLLAVIESHEELRPYLFAIAYRMLGSVAEAEDIVQEAFLRYHEADVEAESPKAYLTTVTTRLAIDQLRSARARREVYPGEWLPEPLVEDEALRQAETADSLSLAFLHLLEKLSPVERAVFLLREVFDYPFEELAEIVGKSPENCRQILARAHKHVQAGRRRFDVSREEREEVARRFLAAWEEGDTEELIELLAPDATVYGDGGGKAPYVPVPLVGRERVAKALIGWGRQAWARGFVHRPARVNGEPGLVFYDVEGEALWVAAFEIADGVVVAVRSVLNPDKLGHVPGRPDAPT